MLRWLRKEKKASGWLAVSIGTEAIHYVHASGAGAGAPTIGAYGSEPLNGDKSGAERVTRELRLDRYRCTTLLSPGEYQFLQVEAPKVPPAELKSAIRWRVKDMIDYHVDDATLDVLEVPSLDSSGAQRAQVMYAVAARNDLIEERIRRFDEARIPLSVIDIPEIGQRNIAALYESEKRGLALLHFARDWGLLTVNCVTELFLARRLELGLDHLAASQEERRKAALERVVVELQRTLDHFERTFRQVAVAELLVGPLPQDVGLVEHLAAGVGIPVRGIDLRDRLDFRQPPPDATTQWRLFHHFGIALREESRSL
jgi:MSHA biogenesis protein MshI